jgi:hypothetical protein
METFSCKVSAIEDSALNTLANVWKCNRAEAARRSIKLALEHTKTAAALDTSHLMLQQIVSIQKESIDLLRELTKFTSLITRINRLEEYVVQGSISAGVLAKQAGLFELAKDEYMSWKNNKENPK